MPNVSPWIRPFPPATCDVAVLGGGIIGASTAHALAELAPELDVVLVDRGEVAGGASGRNAGFLIPGTHTDFATAAERFGRATAAAIWRFTRENIDRVQRLDPAATAYRATGTLLAAGTAGEADRLERSAALIAETGASCVFLDGDRVNRRLGSAGFVAGLAFTIGGTVNPAKLTRHLVEESGATVLEQWPVESLAPAGDAIRISGPGGSFEAGRVIVCLNAYLPQLLPAAERFVRPVRAQMLATGPVEPFLEVPVYSHDGFYYIRQRVDGRLLVGGARHLHEAEEVGYEEDVTDALQGDLESYLATHFPSRAPLAIERRWSGTMGFSPDGLPVVGSVRGLDGALFATGFTGHGMGYGTRFGLLLARLALGAKDEAASLFASDRPSLSRA